MHWDFQHRTWERRRWKPTHEKDSTAAATDYVNESCRIWVYTCQLEQHDLYPRSHVYCFRLSTGEWERRARTHTHVRVLSFRMRRPCEVSLNCNDVRSAHNCRFMQTTVHLNARSCGYRKATAFKISSSCMYFLSHSITYFYAFLIHP